MILRNVSNTRVMGQFWPWMRLLDIIYTSISSVTLNLMLVLFLSITLYALLAEFPSITLYELLVLNSVRNWLQTENFRGRVTDGLTITHLTLYSRIWFHTDEQTNIIDSEVTFLTGFDSIHSLINTCSR